MRWLEQGTTDQISRGRPGTNEWDGLGWRSVRWLEQGTTDQISKGRPEANEWDSLGRRSMGWLNYDRHKRDKWGEISKGRLKTKE